MGYTRELLCVQHGLLFIVRISLLCELVGGRGQKDLLALRLCLSASTILLRLEIILAYSRIVGDIFLV